MVHAEHFGIAKDMPVQGSRIRDNLSNIFADIFHVYQCKLLVPIPDNAVINIDRMRVVRPARWHFGDEYLIPAADINSGIW